MNFQTGYITISYNICTTLYGAALVLRWLRKIFSEFHSCHAAQANKEGEILENTFSKPSEQVVVQLTTKMMSFPDFAAQLPRQLRQTLR